MNDIQVFSNVEFGSVRCIEKDGEPWWVLKDVCEILGIQKTTTIISRLDEDEVGQTSLIDSIGRTQNYKTVNESGLYNVIIRSDKPNAKAFRKWITSEVIPSIRKTGSYGIPQMSQSELILKIAQNHLELEKRIADTESKANAVSQRLDNVLDVFTQPTAENWKDEMNRIINNMIHEYNLNYGCFRRKLYDELETVSGCDLHRRQINLKKRMELAGATYAERQAVTLIDIIAKDEKLKAIFDGIVRKYKIRYANGEYRPGVRMY